MKNHGICPTFESYELLPFTKDVVPTCIGFKSIKFVTEERLYETLIEYNYALNQSNMRY